jgi:hypothetical protein
VYSTCCHGVHSRHYEHEHQHQHEHEPHRTGRQAANLPSSRGTSPKAFPNEQSTHTFCLCKRNPVSSHLQTSPPRLLRVVDSRNCPRTRKRLDCDLTKATLSPTRASIREVKWSPLLSSRTTLRHFSCRTESTISQVEPPSPPELTLAIRLLRLSGLLLSGGTTCAVAIQAEHLLSH